MATPATLNQGKSNRRFIILAVVLGLLGAILVYATFSRDSGSSNDGGSSASAATIPVVVAKEAIPARTTIDPAMLEVRLVAPDLRSELAFSDITQVQGQVTRFPIAANEQVLSSKVIDTGLGASRALSYTIPEGKRALAIQTSDIIGAGGLVLPGDYVDILVIYDIEYQIGTEIETEDNYLVQTLMQNVEVLAVAQAVVDTVPETEPSENGQRARNSEAPANPTASTVTLAVSPEDAQLLYLAESNGRLRLTVRPYGDGEEQPIDFLVETDILPENIPNPFEQ